ncbi:calcium-binding protein [Anopheles sinensis]|uniref:Calcium-binding protein n=1 Tax=Anopheles sinensis TaxID=74873 RepID=A0A084WKB4_ANOSI|nr:calcium-binding protein [Anopheles sinensis]
MKASDSTVKLWSATSSPSTSTENLYVGTHSQLPSAGQVALGTLGKTSGRNFHQQQQQRYPAGQSWTRSGLPDPATGGPAQPSRQQSRAAGKAHDQHHRPLLANGYGPPDHIAEGVGGAGNQLISENITLTLASADGLMKGGSGEAVTDGGGGGGLRCHAVVLYRVRFK